MCVQSDDDALNKAEANLDDEENAKAAEEIIAVILEEAKWRRVKNFVTFLRTGQPNLLKYLFSNDNMTIIGAQ